MTLGFTLFLDQEKHGWKYDDFINVDNYQGSGEPSHLLSFSSDFLVKKNHRDETGSFPLTPHFENMDLVENGSQYHKLRNIRRSATVHLWPALERANTHRIRNDFIKFDSEIRSVDGHKNLESYETKSMPDIIAEGLEAYTTYFSFELEDQRDLIAERIKLASTTSQTAVDELIQFYSTDDRAEQLFLQLHSIHKQWVELYPFFEPLEIVECLKDPNIILSDKYTLSEKPIERLKTFYSDCFETTGRILVIAACYEGIISGAGVGVPARTRLIPPGEYEKKPNGSKPDLISGMPFWPLFNDLFDSKLRNGIGHHSWRYDAETDVIHYQNSSPSRGVEKFEIPYLDFCIHTRALYHALTVATKYVHSVWIK